MDKIDFRNENLIPLKDEMVVVYYQKDKVNVVCISLKSDESIGVSLEKGYVIARTQYETKFVCKGKDFICLWK